jgi:hypothetical protein
LKTVTALGDFSTMGFTMAGLGEPRFVRAGVVGGSYFDVMGLRPVRGRLIDATDDGPDAAVNGRLMWTDPVSGVRGAPRRIVGVAADIDDENIVPGPAMTVYHPSGQYGFGGRLFVHMRTENPYALAPSITRIIRQMSAEQVVGRAATLEDVRAEALAPDRLNALVFGGFALVALTIAIVWVAGVSRRPTVRWAIPARTCASRVADLKLQRKGHESPLPEVA